MASAFKIYPYKAASTRFRAYGLDERDTTQWIFNYCILFIVEKGAISEKNEEDFISCSRSQRG